MFVSRRPIGRGVTIQGDDEAFVLRPARIEWYEPHVVFLFDSALRQYEQPVTLGRTVEVRPYIFLCVRRLTWGTNVGRNLLEVEIGINAPQGTAIIPHEVAPWRHAKPLLTR
ncbi:hypothetical protein LCGC14_0622970 [marine sediment metagenome]|uniref:Uncharacterized protein n=1 Tax=marine sediment metagenome TaxID=412755 RepID=A0A0F9R4A7_9ZZZZ